MRSRLQVKNIKGWLRVFEAHPGTQLEAFGEWLRRHRGTREATIDRHRKLVSGMRSQLGADPRRYDAASVRNVLLRRFATASRSHALTLATSMRMYLRLVIQAAVDGIGMAVGNGEMVAKELATGKLVPLAHLSVASEKSYHLIMNPLSANDRTLVRLREWLLQECAGCKLSNG